LIQVLYFLIAVILLGGIGVWLPFAIDYFPKNIISEESMKTLPGNLLTYYLSIFSVSLVDRIRYMLKDDRYRYKEFELLLSILVSAGCIYLTYYSFSFIYQKKYCEAIEYCKYATYLSFIVWWIANIKQPKTNSTQILGGTI
jgi:hypothetical protein